VSANPYARVVAIDGPSASGKTTVARAVAEKLGSTVFDTGALYRAVTLASIRRGIAPSDEAALSQLTRDLTIDITSAGAVLIDGEDVSAELRTPQVDRWVSEVSAHPAVRSALLPVQRSIASGRPVVMVGRDIATVVIPEAGLKVYLDASAEERARRRYGDLESSGAGVSYEDVRSEIERRDTHDSSRATSPLKLHEDALVVHTDDKTVDEVAGMIAGAYEEKSASPEPVLVQAPFTVETKPEYFAQSARRRKRGKLAYWAIWPWLHRVADITQEGVSNIPPFGPLLYVSNHLHNLDPGIEFYAFTRPLNFMGKQELFETPVVRQISEASGGFPVDRGKFDREALRQAEDRLEKGLTVGIYAEGTRSVTGALTEAKAGVGLIALKTGAPVLPVAITGSERLPFNGSKGDTADLHKDDRPGVHIVYGEPFYLPRTVDGRKISATEATDIIMLEIARLLPESYRGVYAEKLAAQKHRLIIPYSSGSSSSTSSKSSSSKSSSPKSSSSSSGS
jgi:cytidylate kinase